MSECLKHHNACACREAMFAQAVEIADEAMADMLRSCSLSADESGVAWTLCNGNGDAVATLDEAYPPAIDAVRWLLQRNLCHLVESPEGATVVLLEADG